MQITNENWVLLSTVIRERDELRNQLSLLRTKNKILYDEISSVKLFFKNHPIHQGVLDIHQLPQLLKKDNPIIFDIGCNDGFHTFRFFDLFPNAIIHSFEPDPRPIKRFNHFAPKYPKARLHQIALGAQSGDVTFYASGGETDKMPEGWDMSGSIKKPTGHLLENPTISFNHSFAVKVETLDEWCHKHHIDKIDFIWADVQGAEADLIKGGINTFTNKVKFFYTEYSNKELYEGQPTLEKIQEMLPSFSIRTVFENDVLLENKGKGN